MHKHILKIKVHSLYYFVYRDKREFRYFLEQKRDSKNVVSVVVVCNIAHRYYRMKR